MAIASPYTVFRAPDLGAPDLAWLPPPVPSPAPPIAPNAHPQRRHRPRKRALSRVSLGDRAVPCGWEQLIQGELFGPSF
ncbi:hypothetical protein [Cyanobium sp. NIES-981]|uniref:hypothetical protein n=1 Tax=Cyanobium sp. NIES-981 TaxID=1851505 RepID=UPI000B35AD81|nr:hypothetical protein [Cyanobium sp. NIES-981]